MILDINIRNADLLEPQVLNIVNLKAICVIIYCYFIYYTIMLTFDVLSIIWKHFLKIYERMGTITIQLYKGYETTMKKRQPFLGIHIDDNFSWRHHIANVNKIISSALFSINHVNDILPKDCLKNLYYSLIHPHLSCGLFAWENCNRSSIII